MGFYRFMVWLNLLAYQECVSLQGTVTRDEYFFMAYKIKSVLCVYALVVFKILYVFIAKKIKCQVFTCFFENT
jgi:hypothetical protein